MPDAPAPARPSFKTLFGLACLTAFLASLAGLALFVAGASLMPDAQGTMGWSNVLLPFAVIGFLFTFPIGLVVLLLVGPLAAWRLAPFIRDHRGPAALIGLVVGALLGLTTTVLLFGDTSYLAASGTVSGGCFGLLWMWLCAWQLKDEAPHG